ncbi:uncharacterized protein LOC135224084 [Macrobrachium nipponense]|uniref:uncharacterized protein LOC135224084 n=1 Tax=Macrobrachium nipponense TaxID=159736 RepID=UPI0030C86D8D
MCSKVLLVSFCLVALAMGRPDGSHAPAGYGYEAPRHQPSYEDGRPFDYSYVVQGRLPKPRLRSQVHLRREGGDRRLPRPPPRRSQSDRRLHRRRLQRLPGSGRLPWSSQLP